MNHSPARTMLPHDSVTTLSIGTCATLACVWEVTTPKPGNVHRGADFEDVTFGDFVTSATIVGPTLECAASRGVGPTVLSAVRATRAAVGTNTNLGTLLLLAPLAAVPREQSLHEGIGTVLANLRSSDADLVYEAIRIARPGGLGHVDDANIATGDGPPNGCLVSAMRQVASRDLVARQYTNAFREVFQCAVPWIEQPIVAGFGIADAVGNCFLRLLAKHPDGLIDRKCGPQLARQAADRAADVLARGSIDSPEYRQGLADLDFWLRSDGHRRNPGTTADLVAAGLFVLLREGRLTWPVTF